MTRRQSCRAPAALLCRYARAFLRRMVLPYPCRHARAFCAAWFYLICAAASAVSFLQALPRPRVFTRRKKIPHSRVFVRRKKGRTRVLLRAANRRMLPLFLFPRSIAFHGTLCPVKPARVFGCAIPMRLRTCAAFFHIPVPAFRFFSPHALLCAVMPVLFCAAWFCLICATAPAVSFLQAVPHPRVFTRRKKIPHSRVFVCRVLFCPAASG